MKVGLTGANGHLGLTTLKLLLSHGYKVHATLRDLRWTTHPSLKNLPCDFFQADLTNLNSLEKAFKDCSVIFHIAAPSLTWTENIQRDIIQPILEGTKNVLKAASQAKVQRVIMTSSCSAIGLQSQTPLTEENWNSDLRSPALFSKMLAEKWAWKNHSNFNLDFFSICVPFMVGPGYIRPTPSSELLRGPAQGFLLPMPKFGFHLVDVRDVANAHLLAAHCRLNSQRFIVAGEYVNNKILYDKIKALRPKTLGISQPIPFPIVRFVSKMEEIQSVFTKRPIKLPKDFVEDIKDLDQRVSAQKAKTLLGWQARDLEITLKDFWEWQMPTWPDFQQTQSLTY